VLELRPNCECCDRDLPPNATDARICSYECTFCTSCTDNVLHGICPNCGGNLMPRPIRPPEKLVRHPASAKRVLKLEGCHQAV
jgi:uncharacterized protein